MIPQSIGNGTAQIPSKFPWTSSGTSRTPQPENAKFPHPIPVLHRVTPNHRKLPSRSTAVRSHRRPSPIMHRPTLASLLRQCKLCSQWPRCHLSGRNSNRWSKRTQVVAANVLLCDMLHRCICVRSLLFVFLLVSGVHPGIASAFPCLSSIVSFSFLPHMFRVAYSHFSHCPYSPSITYHASSFCALSLLGCPFMPTARTARCASPTLPLVPQPC